MTTTRAAVAAEPAAGPATTSAVNPDGMGKEARGEGKRSADLWWWGNKRRGKWGERQETRRGKVGGEKVGGGGCEGRVEGSNHPPISGPSQLQPPGLVCRRPASHSTSVPVIAYPTTYLGMQ